MEEEKAGILIVDDVVPNLLLLSEMIRKAGYTARPVVSVRQAIQAVDAMLPNLILLDISMPEIDGFEYCKMLKQDVRTREIPIIFISAMNSPENKAKGLSLGAVDFITKPFDVSEVTMRVNNHLKIYQMQKEMETYNRRMQLLVSEQLTRLTEERKNLIRVMARLNLLHGKQQECSQDSLSYNCRLLAMSLQFSPEFEKEVSEEFVDMIELAVLVRDIGNLLLPDQLLQSRERYTDEERFLMQLHTGRGAKLLKNISQITGKNEILSMAMDIANFHHERYDGSGYPEGRKGKEIPLSARIAGIVDVYSALTKERPFRPAYSHTRSMELMMEHSGSWFEPGIMELFVRIQRQLKQ